MCIYFSDQDDLAYKNQEHIFPAGLGGIGMLPRGYVSDQANALFSPLELRLMHNSLLMIPRTIFGPGKRGSLDPNKASKSEITTLQSEDGKIALGYVVQGKSCYISSLTKCGAEFTYTVGTAQRNDPIQSWSDFKQACSNFNLCQKFVSVHTNELSPSDWIFGFYSSKYYLALGKECSLDTFYKEMEFIVNSSQSGPLRRKETHPQFDFAIEESDYTSRIYAKTAINVLAHMMGENYINHTRFRPIKDWILGKTKSDVFSQLPRITPENVLGLPEQCHWCLFKKHDQKICAVVCFYNSYSRYFELAESIEQYDRAINSTVFGLLCDWRAKREYTLEQWIYRRWGMQCP